MMISSVVLAGGTTGPSETTKSSKMAIVKSGDGVKVFYKPSEKGKVKITIYNSKNNVVFSEEVKSRLGFIRPYNLNDLPEGEYRVVMQDENEMREELVSTVKDVNVKNVKPLAGIIRANKNQLAVTFYSPSGSEVTVTVLDNKKRILFSEAYSIEGRDIKLFNLEDLKGATQVEVTGKDGVIKSVAL
jgi:hypothetical protein